MFEFLTDPIRARYAILRNSREGAFLRCLEHLHDTDRRWRKRGSASGFPLGQYFEFGVWNGASMQLFWKTLRLHGRFDRKAWTLTGFDSFEGLPDPVGNADAHPFVGKGAFKSAGVQYVGEQLARASIPAAQVKLIPGFYEASLTTELRISLGTPRVCFANIDVDYHSSTKTVLDWLEPLLFDGAIVYFDDVAFYNGNPNKGQIRAIREFNESRKGAGLHEERGLDPWGRVHLYWRDDEAQLKSENLKF